MRFKKIHPIALSMLFLPVILSAFNHSFYVGPKHGYRRIHFNNPGKLDGFMTGVATGFKWSHKWFISCLKYEGNFSSPLLHGNPCQRSKIHEHMLSFLIGGRWDACENFCFSGAFGVGFDRFFNHQDPSTASCPKVCDDSDGLRYKYTKIFVPIHIMGSWFATDNTTVSLCAEFRPDVFARLRIKTKTCSGNLLCGHLNNKRSFGARVALPIKHTLHRNDRFYVQWMPFFDWNKFGSVCALNGNGNPYSIPYLKSWDIGMQCLFGVQF